MSLDTTWDATAQFLQRDIRICEVLDPVQPSFVVEGRAAREFETPAWKFSKTFTSASENTGCYVLNLTKKT
jgi:hypothetical protein